MILRDETIQRFMYDPDTLPRWSKRRVLRRCEACGRVNSVQFKAVSELCRSCASRQAMTCLIASAKAIGTVPNGLPIGVNRENLRRYNREWRRRERMTLRGKVINRIRVALRNALDGRGNLGVLPYGRNALVSHIRGELERYAYLCPLCRASLNEKFDIDHRIPLSSVATVEEIVGLFALENLSVLCPSCNQHKKRDAELAY